MHQQSHPVFARGHNSVSRKHSHDAGRAELKFRRILELRTRLCYIHGFVMTRSGPNPPKRRARERWKSPSGSLRFQLTVRAACQASEHRRGKGERG